MTTEELQQAIADIPGAVLGSTVERGELIIEIAPSTIVPVLRDLQSNQSFERLSGITCVDWYPVEPRFEIVYLLHSIRNNQRLRLKCMLPGDNPEIDSVFEIYSAADWYEREAFDLFGVKFRNHPNLKRILMPDDWEGHPLRKDYPVHGYKYSYQNE